MKYWKAAAVIIMWCMAILVLMYAVGESAETLDNRKDDSKRVIVAPKKDKTIIVLESDKDSSTIINLDNMTITYCTSDDGSVIICTDLD